MRVSVPTVSIRPPMVLPSLAICDEEFAGLAVFEQADGEVAFVARDLELVGERHARVGHAVAHRLVQPDRATRDFLSSSTMRASSSGRSTMTWRARSVLACRPCPWSFSVQRRGALRAVAINGDRLQTELPAFDVGVHDVVDRGRFRQVDRLGDRAAEERLRGGHHPEMAPCSRSER